MPQLIQASGTETTWTLWVQAQQTAVTSSTNDLIWTSWNENSGALATTATSNDIWKVWITATSTSATTTGVDPWIVWNQNVGSASTVVQARAQPRISDEEYRARRAERERRYEEEVREASKAKERAAVLLQESLSDAQREELRAKGHFTLTVIDSETQERRLYRINRGRHGNVDQVDVNGKILKSFCIHPTIACPDEDTMLTQKFWLESREREFLRVANHIQPR